MTTTPEVGDMVIYVGDSESEPWKRRRESKKRFIVQDIATADKSGYGEPAVRAVEAGTPGVEDRWSDDWWVAGFSSVRVVAKARYEVC